MLSATEPSMFELQLQRANRLIRFLPSLTNVLRTFKGYLSSREDNTRGTGEELFLAYI